MKDIFLAMRLCQTCSILLLILDPRVTSAQVTTGSIVGTARDSSGAVAPGARITITNIRTNSTRTDTTDANGNYIVSALPPSDYSLKAEKPGFKTFLATQITLPVGGEIRMDIALEVGQVSEQVTVEATAALLETETTSLSHVMNQKRIVDLPLNGRNFLELAALSAGAIPKMSNRSTQYGNRNQYVTIGGGRDSSTNYLIDGIEARSLRFNNSSLQPSVDAIQEFKVERNAFSAEYGRGVGVVNVAIRSGSNAFHGSLYEFFRNSKLDARNFFDATRPPFRQNQYGFAFGGPIKRNKLFFFSNYEGLRSRKGQTFLSTVPDPAQLRGDFRGLNPIYDPETTRPDPANPAAIIRSPFPNNIVPPERIHPFARSFNTLFPAPNRSGPLNYISTSTFVDDFDQLNLRGDIHLSEKDNMFARYSWYDGTQLLPGAFQQDPRPQNGHNATLQHTRVMTTSLLNELRLGYNRSIHFTRPLPAFGDRNIVQELGLRNLGGLRPDLYGIPAVGIAGISARGENTLNQGSVENIITFNDKFTINRGRHNFRVGFEFQDIRYQQQGEVNPRGNFSFSGVFTDPQGTTRAGNALADYLLGLPNQAQAGLGAGDAFFNFQSFSTAIFLQEDWRITPTLTLNVGVRWQYDRPFREKTYKEGNFAEDLGLLIYSKEPTGAIFPAMEGLYVPGNTVRHGIWDPDFNNFAPRLGLAWRPFGQRTVIRSGFGVFYENTNGNEFQFTGLLPPFYGINTLISRTDIPSFTMSDMFPDVRSLTSLPAPFSVFRRDRTPYTMQWNFSIQQKLTDTMLLELAYQGSGSRKLWQRFNQNQATPDPTGRIPIEQRVPFPKFQAGLLTSGRDANASYHAFTARLEQSYHSGLNFQSVYSFSRNIDTNSGEFEANQMRFRWDKRANRGLSRYHQKHRFASNFGYELPVGPGKKWLSDVGFGGKLLEGWQIQGILSLATGFPFTPTANVVHGTGSFVPQFADRIADGNLSSDQRSVDRWFDTAAFRRPAVGTFGTSGRNVLIGPGVANLDFALQKNTRIRETITLQFRAESFNITNNAQFFEPVANVDSPTFGRITSAADPRRIQFGLKLLF
ncbi:MAG TPA: carboxypeptidase regulatory-like domain-containing protein [Bryobacteraceae bacterium]|nr:carboxypeptidase regulatory-like domain-containing protein [Bryobacteraceae bacterium]